MSNATKWDNYYNQDKTPPPWESSLPFHGLMKALEEYSLSPDKYRDVIELGSGIYCNYCNYYDDYIYILL